MSGKRRRRQCAALPLSVSSGGELKVLLVTSRETKRWILPKGWLGRGVAPADQAAREALEEAGLTGEIGRKAIGSYRYLKLLPRGRAVPCRVDVFPLMVACQVEDWPERGQRELGWFAPDEAAELVDEAELAALLRRVAAGPPRATPRPRPSPAQAARPPG